MARQQQWKRDGLMGAVWKVMDWVSGGRLMRLLRAFQRAFLSAPVEILLVAALLLAVEGVCP